MLDKKRDFFPNRVFYRGNFLELQWEKIRRNAPPDWFNSCSCFLPKFPCLLSRKLRLSCGSGSKLL
jgi:hypothetical protein